MIPLFSSLLSSSGDHSNNSLSPWDYNFQVLESDITSAWLISTPVHYVFRSCGNTAVVSRGGTLSEGSLLHSSSSIPDSICFPGGVPYLEDSLPGLISSLSPPGPHKGPTNKPCPPAAAPHPIYLQMMPHNLNMVSSVVFSDMTGPGKARLWMKFALIEE